MIQLEQDKQSLKEKFGNESTDILSLLKSMLEFDKTSRPTAAMLLKHKIFDPIRQPKQECVPPLKIFSELENNINFDASYRQVIRDAADA